MIALDPEFVGALAPPSKLTTAAALAGAPEVPFARLPRLDRLRVLGKADETEVDGAEDGVGGADEGQGEPGSKATPSRAEKEKKKMRGKGKSLKRYATTACVCGGEGSHGRRCLTIGTCANSARTSLTQLRYVVHVSGSVA